MFVGDGERVGAASPSDEDLHDAPAGVVGRDLVGLSNHLSQTMFQLCRHVAVFDSKSGPELDGQRSARSWLVEHAGLGDGAARDLVKIARRLRQLPAMTAAAEAGELSWEQIRILVTVASDDSFDDFIETEAVLVEACRELGVRDTRRIAQHWRKVYAQRDDKALSDAQHKARSVYLSRSLDGHWILNGTLDPEAGRIVESGLQRLIDTQRRHEHTPGNGDECPEDPRHMPQRRADALVDMARLACGWRPDADGPVENVVIDGTARPTVELVVDLDTLQHDSGELCEYLDLSPLPAETARRLCCDGALGRIITANSVPLDVGRQSRTPTRSIRRALDLRDGGCAFPGCGQHPRLCDAHHIVHWAHHGETKLENLVLLCWWHHRLVHEGGWTVAMGPDQRPVFEAADGRKFNATPPRPALPHQLRPKLRPQREQRAA